MMWMKSQEEKKLVASEVIGNERVAIQPYRATHNRVDSVEHS
jgi:hypothetical protein